MLLSPARLFVLAALIGLLFLPGKLPAAETVGRVAVVEGSAFATAPEGQARSLAPRAPIFQNDTIATGADGRLQLFFLDETIFTIGPDSNVTIDSYVFDPASSTGEFLANSTKGAFRMVTGKISRTVPGKVKLRTPAATIGIRGCYLVGALDESRKALTLLFLGGLQGEERGIYAENPGGITQLTTPGFGLEVPAPNVAPSAPMPFNRQRIQNLMAPTRITTGNVGPAAPGDGGNDGRRDGGDGSDGGDGDGGDDDGGPGDGRVGGSDGPGDQDLGGDGGPLDGDPLLDTGGDFQFDDDLGDGPPGLDAAITQPSVPQIVPPPPPPPVVTPPGPTVPKPPGR